MKGNATNWTRSALIVVGIAMTQPALCATGGGSLFPHRPAPIQQDPGNPVPEAMQLVFADEFDGDRLDWDIWESHAYAGDIKRETARGPDNLEVKDGELRLHVRKESLDLPLGKRNTWTAGYVYIREPVGTNVYVESRFKSSASSGVNNAFWLASVTAERTSWSNRYEIDVVETRRDAGQPDKGKAHLAWHDWKTYSYITNPAGSKDHIAQGTQVEHTWDAYHTWGLWLGENEFIYYLDGREIWRGTTHERYHDQWETGIGKFDKWFPDEEDRAYGRHGQDNWRYYGGFTGDQMNIVFSTLPWAASWSPLDDAADGTWMAVDYVRVFRPVRLMADQPVQHLRGEQMTSPSIIPLEGMVNLPDDQPAYVALRFSREPWSSLRVELLGQDNQPVGWVAVEEDYSITPGLGDGSASTRTSWPANYRFSMPEGAGGNLILVIRFTPDDNGTGAILSGCLFPEDTLPDNEPYLYHNVDRHGNTSLNMGWDIACKAQFRTSPEALRLQVSGGLDLLDLQIGGSFSSVTRFPKPDTAEVNCRTMRPLERSCDALTSAHNNQPTSTHPLTMKASSALILAAWLAGASFASAAVSVTSGDFSYAQDFSSLPSTGTVLNWTNNQTIPGWYRDYYAGNETVKPPYRDVSVQATGASGSGVTTQDGFINIGVEAGTPDQTDFSRALVLRRNFSFYGALGVVFRNDSGTMLDGFNLGYTGEQWRRHGDGVATSLYVEYAVLGTDAGLDIDTNPDGSGGIAWTRVPALEFVSPNIAGTNSGINGNLDINRTVIEPVRVDAKVPNSSFLVIRWYQDRTASDGSAATTARHALGIDNMSVTMIPGPADANIWADRPSSDGWRYTGSVWLYDVHYPFVYDYALGWLYLFPGSTPSNLYFYRYAAASVIWIYPSWSWYFNYSQAAWLPVQG